jgi:hypothetical protein
MSTSLPDFELRAEEEPARIHIPVVTNPDVEFFLNGTRVMLEAGSAWYLRLSDRHSVHYKGADDRVHVLVDATVNDWLRSELETAVRRQGALA